MFQLSKLWHLGNFYFFIWRLESVDLIPREKYYKCVVIRKVMKLLHWYLHMLFIQGWPAVGKIVCWEPRSISWGLTILCMFAICVWSRKICQMSLKGAGGCSRRRTHGVTKHSNRRLKITSMTGVLKALPSRSGKAFLS